MDEPALRQAICHAAHQLWQRGLIAGTDGGIVAELHRRRYLATPPGRRRADLQPRDLITVDVDGVDQSQDLTLDPTHWLPHHVALQMGLAAASPGEHKQGRAIRASVLASPPRLSALLALRPQDPRFNLHAHPPVPIVWPNDEDKLTRAIAKSPIVGLHTLGIFAADATLESTIAALERAEQAATTELILRQQR